MWMICAVSSREGFSGCATMKFSGGPELDTIYLGEASSQKFMHWPYSSSSLSTRANLVTDKTPREEFVDSLTLPQAADQGHAISVMSAESVGDITQRKCADRRTSGSKTTTPICANKLYEWLTPGYDVQKTDFLVDGFTYGFKIPSSKSFSSTVPPNLKSALDLPLVVLEKISKELRKGRIAGPFHAKPFPNLICSPIGLVPKKAPNTFRMIQHLSYPKLDSVNSHIPDGLKSVTYATTDDAVRLVLQAGQCAFMCKTDICDAFRLLPIHPLSHHLFGFRFSDAYFYDKFLPMGCSVSCRYFEEFSTALEWLAKERLGISSIIHILDDFFLVTKTFEDSKRSLQQFLKMCFDLGVPMSSEKTVGPSQVLSFAGLEIDSNMLQIRLPADKLLKCRSLVEVGLSRKKLKLRELQSLIGSLNFACRAVQPGRAFLRRLIDLTIGIRNPNHYIRLNKWAKEDLRAWSIFLNSYNGITFMSKDIWSDHSDAVHLYTDAAGGVGFGAFVDDLWFFGEWPSNWHDENITLLELFPIALSIHVWGGSLFANRKVIFHSDNSAIVSVINKRSSREPKVMVFIRDIVIQTMSLNINFKALFLEGFRNQPADALSRLQVDRFRLLHPSASQTPTVIPPSLLPENWKMH